jgi:hypothetical protein
MLTRLLSATGLTLGLLLVFGASPAWADEAGFPEFEDQSLFRPKFLEQAFNAEKDGNPAAGLEAFYKTLTNPAEQAEVELRIARVYNQRTGFVDYAKSITWYDKALVRPLPLKTQAMLLILRGNSHELVKHPEPALADYVRGLLICLHYRLPEKWPVEEEGKFAPPALNDGIGEDDADPATAARRQEERQHRADYRRESEINRTEQGLVTQKYYYVDAIKRVVEKEKMKEQALRDIVEHLTNRKDRIEEVLRLAKAPNPWPGR